MEDESGANQVGESEEAREENGVRYTLTPVTIRSRFVTISASFFGLLLRPVGGADWPQIIRTPESIKSFLESHPDEDCSELWRVLTISPVIPRSPYRPGPVTLNNELGAVQVSLFDIKLTTDDRKFILLRFAWNYSQVFRYILFAGNGQSWHVAGYVDHDFAKYFEPSHQVRQLGAKRWLVFTFQTGSGSGFQQATEKWFQLDSDGRLAQALDFISMENENCGVEPDNWRTINAHALSDVTKGPIENLTVEYSGELRVGGPYQKPQRTVRKRVIFTRKGADGMFGLDVKRSGITANELRNIFRFCASSR